MKLDLTKELVAFHPIIDNVLCSVTDAAIVSIATSQKKRIRAILHYSYRNGTKTSRDFLFTIGGYPCDMNGKRSKHKQCLYEADEYRKLVDLQGKFSGSSFQEAQRISHNWTQEGFSSNNLSPDGKFPLPPQPEFNRPRGVIQCRTEDLRPYAPPSIWGKLLLLVRKIFAK